jgi:YfiR/HmsC-like
VSLCASAARRRFAIFLTLGLLAKASPLAAEIGGVPLGLQAQLTAKLAAHDKGMAARAGSTLKIVILIKRENAESANAAAHLLTAFEALDSIAGLSHQQKVLAFTDARALAALVRTETIAIIYLTQGFDEDLDAIGASLDGVSVMSIATVPDYVVRGGAVIGFDLVSGRSKILVNLAQARRQGVQLDSNVLMIATVFK